MNAPVGCADWIGARSRLDRREMSKCCARAIFFLASSPCEVYVKVDLSASVSAQIYSGRLRREGD
jgi:hypothetical protein